MNSNLTISSMDHNWEDHPSSGVVLEGEEFLMEDGNLLFNLMEDRVDVDSATDQDARVITEKLYADFGSDIHFGGDLTTLDPADYNYGTTSITEMTSLTTPTTDEIIESVLDIPLTLPYVSEDVITVVSPPDVEEPPKRKRGHKPKSETGPHISMTSMATPTTNKIIATPTVNEIIESEWDASTASLEVSDDVITVVVSSAEVEDPPEVEQGNKRKSETGPNFSISMTTPAADEIIESVLDTPSASPDVSDDVTTVVVSPLEVEMPPKRKRGRRPKSETGPYVPPPRRRKPRKRKIYEINEPFNDEHMEKKRLNAINAKKHRDEAKAAKQTLVEELKEVKKERDSLKKEVEMLREKEAETRKQLDDIKKQAYALWSGLGEKSLPW